MRLFLAEKKLLFRNNLDEGGKQENHFFRIAATSVVCRERSTAIVNQMASTEAASNVSEYVARTISRHIETRGTIENHCGVIHWCFLRHAERKLLYDVTITSLKPLPRATSKNHCGSCGRGSHANMCAAPSLLYLALRPSTAVLRFGGA